MSVDYKIENTTEADLEFIYWLYEEAIRYQSWMGYNVWRGYDREVLQREQKENLQHKLLIDGNIALVFSAIYSDKYLWRERENDDAVYVHRLVVNPEFRGHKLFTHVFQWLIDDAKQRGRKYLRLDTWGDNPKMIAYYQSFGYKFIENFSSGNNPELPIPHRNLFFALMEYEIPQHDKQLQIVDYTPEHYQHFKKINLDWISKSYIVEEIDKKVLDNPDEYILKNGGAILMAIYNNEIVGTCSLTNEGENIYELTKMGVDENFRGLKIGYQLGIATIEKAKQLKAKKVILYSNTKHSDIAINLYRKLGFIEVPLDTALWIRADIKMEILISSHNNYQQ